MNHTAITQYEFESAPVRTIDIDGDPWFVAKDVCVILGLTHVSDACSKLDLDEKGRYLIPTPGGKQKMLVVSESGLYFLTFRCREASEPGTTPYRFRKWVTAEVLPAIRKTGRYEAETEMKAFNRPTKGTFAFLSREFRGARRLASAMGLMGGKAVTAANTAVTAQYGVDCMQMMGVDEDQFYTFGFPDHEASVKAWLEERADVGDPSAQTSLAALFADFEEWHRHNRDEAPLGRRTFSGMLRALGFHVFKRGVYLVARMRLKQEETANGGR